MDYLARLKNLQKAKVPTDKTDRSKTEPSERPEHLLPDGRQEPTLSPAHRKGKLVACPACGGTNWGPTGRILREMLPSGCENETEVWGCLDCAATCPECGMDNIVKDVVGPYCVDCRQRINPQETPDHVQQ